MKTAIVVLSWGKASLTRGCFESLIEHTPPASYELFWVQNEAEKERKAMDKIEAMLVESGIAHEVIRNTDNLGFPGGVNSALPLVQASNHPYTCLLNNDTKLTEGWLESMIKAMPEDCGAIGCLTDNGGFQTYSHMSKKYLTVDEPRSGDDYASYSRRVKALPHQFIETSELAFFCTVLPSKVWDTVGYLDTRFGMGYGEDNDYCLRLREMGHSVGVCITVAIHHDHGGTSGLKGEARQKVNERAFSILQDKWGSQLQ